ncbi:Mediator of RNA polymerase II transcription subunit 13 [Psilocybe cubensis]|uniref:Mediator of RNA polymerase II transcription subunit 13 n=2 Tax=Psilocybe cubensis TaxID=181762 RepID=A0A8H8CLB7_PSICU|nr:Mediator of RNA polymerase II transcription subunit 13 [Psilocybe cubensis]KAH9483026.1 Mediator of RNA polymerase II transcription subunit 13 [Psilocybe cubensis]
MLAAILDADLRDRLALPVFADGLLVRHSVFCQLHVYQGLVHPLLLPTPFAPLNPQTLTPGAPITLLPHATPAYFLAVYQGPTAALAAQFADEGVVLAEHRFVIVWIAVQNTHGDHKGLLATYPQELCLVSSIYRPSLSHLPELPPQLHQLSPVLSPPIARHPLPSVYAFRALTVHRSKPLRSVAAEVGGYVDAVARERERERERLKRERDSPKTPKQPPAPAPVQSFYPSPPQPLPVKASPVPSPSPPPPAPLDPDPPADPWPTFDDYLFDDLGYTFAHPTSTAPSTNIPNPIPSNPFEDAFTDDDFSFFDRPATPATSPPNQPAWTPAPIDTPISIDNSPPELVRDTTVLSSAAPSPDFHTPLTPNVYLEHSHSPGFDPIPFSDYHRRADDKHANGKFAPRPPDQEGWRRRYDEITDPRIRLVRKLQARQLKSEDHQQPLWQSDDMDVDSPSSSSSSDESDIFQDSRYRGIEVDDIPERSTTPPPAYLPPGAALLRTKFEHRALLALSVPLRGTSSPAPPASTSNTGLQPPQSLASVPTPVSPAAHAGQEAERLRALAAAAQQVAREAVENPVWARVWRAASGGHGVCHAATALASTRLGGIGEARVSPRDVKLVMKALENVREQLIQEGHDPAQLKVGLGMEELFGLDSTPIYPLEEPMLSIAKGDVVLDLKPPSLLFWEKLGLCPKGGPKNFDALVMFEDDDTRRVWVDTWVEGLKDVYKAKRYGAMNMAKAPMSIDGSPGLIAVRYDATLRKHFANLVASMSVFQSPNPLVVFLVLPFAIMSLASPVLRQILALCRKLLASNARQIILQLVPEVHVVHGMEPSAPYAYGTQMEWMAASVYNKILVPVDRERTARAGLIHPGMPHAHRPPEVRRLFMNPSFTLARPPRASITYVRAAHAPLDVVDRYTLLHVGYALSACGRWVVACCTDQRGEAWDSRVWLVAGDADTAEEPKGDGWTWADVIRRVWDFAMAFAKRANVEWRVVFARLGAMEQSEVDAWAVFLRESVVGSRELPPLHHYVVCVVPDAPWMFTPWDERNLPLVVPTTTTRVQATSASVPGVGGVARPVNASKVQEEPQHQQTVFTDVSSATYAVFPKRTLPIFVPPSLDDLGLTRSFVPEDPAGDVDPAPPSSSSSARAPVIPQATSILIRVPRATSIPTLSSSSASPMASLSFSSATMIHTHLLHSAHSASYTQHAQTTMSDAGRVPSDDKLLEEVTKGYFDLAVLARVRCGVEVAGGSTRDREGLPFHLAAVDLMRMVLEGCWEASLSSFAGEV